MASYTPNLNLLKKSPVTDGNDTFNVDTMLNDNWDKIDKYAKDTNTLANSALSKANSIFYYGTYTGDGTKNRTINLGFTPNAVLVLQNGEGVRDVSSNTAHNGGLALTGSPVQYDWYVHEDNKGTSTVVAITTNGFIVNQESTAFATGTNTNSSGTKYNYIAFRK